MPIFWIWAIIVLVIFLFGGVTIIVVRYSIEINKARKRLASYGSRVIETDFGPIEYAQTGSGYPVLAIHGAMGGFDQGLWVANGFGLSGNRIIAVSRYGYLRSPVPKTPDLNHQADVYAGLLDLLGVQKVAVFGISAGSTSAIRFAARHPGRVSALILLGPDAPGENYLSVPPRYVFNTLLRSDFAYWVMFTFFAKSMQKNLRLTPKDFTVTPEYEKMVKTLQLGDLPVSDRMDGMILECYESLPELEESVTAASPYPLSQIQTPVLVLNAVDDLISIPANVRRLAEQLPKMRMHVVPEGGHFFFGHVEEVSAVIKQFLDEHTRQ
jgi:pimeloyl-ACP methyl ester carboxylesterase